ncbi:ATP-binding protein [Streptomyces meridianus]|uniref:ATP-binding protein n=1 Tax=Streptomyces meridianus TaxID=2938945 RepID=A0ABT0X124_9ACTN|nr:ATP-binding protein [Streptomyces meridianus]MCM2575855.1 ATP-binding protein [Streptomyces meridianus]
MGSGQLEVTPSRWQLEFLAESAQLASLRQLVRKQLLTWGVPQLVEAAELCVSELVANVVTHVGPGTPATLALSLSGGRLRIDVHDPDARALPTLLMAGPEAEGGRGVRLVDAVAQCWGVILTGRGKVTWCELGHAGLGGTPQPVP